MEWRGPVLVVALLAIGAGSGFAASAVTRDPTIGTGVPSPVAAARPDLPIEAPKPFAPDPDDPALQPGVRMRQTSVGTGKFELVFPVPVGWRSNITANNEWKWKRPGTSNNTYVMRVEQINSQDIAIEDAIDIRVERLLDEQEDVDIIDRGADTLEYTYRSNEGNQRHSFMRWLDLDDSGQADVEIVVHGRESDVRGTRDLIRRVGDGMRGATGGLVP